jgi:hypothetical protein
MAFFRRKWTPADAEEWTKEDLWTCILSAIAYTTLTVGFGMSLLLIPIGFVIFGVGLATTLLMFLIIDPKLKVISDEYETKQKEYIEHLERVTRWEED